MAPLASDFSKAAAAFTQQSDKYRITLIAPYDNEDIDAYLNETQMEISAGRVPDLMNTYVIDPESLIANWRCLRMTSLHIQCPPSCMTYSARNWPPTSPAPAPQKRPPRDWTTECSFIQMKTDKLTAGTAKNQVGKIYLPLLAPMPRTPHLGHTSPHRPAQSSRKRIPSSARTCT